MEKSVIENMKETLLTPVANHIFNIGGLKIFFELVSARDS